MFKWLWPSTLKWFQQLENLLLPSKCKYEISIEMSNDWSLVDYRWFYFLDLSFHNIGRVMGRCHGLVKSSKFINTLFTPVINVFNVTFAVNDCSQLNHFLNRRRFLIRMQIQRQKSPFEFTWKYQSFRVNIQLTFPFVSVLHQTLITVFTWLSSVDSILLLNLINHQIHPIFQLISIDSIALSKKVD